MLVVFVLGAIGVLPSSACVGRWVSRVVGERHPCEACLCGCGSADECWRRCCCHSEHERLVWAIREGVAPPPSVRFSDDQYLEAMRELDPEACGLCVTRIKSRLASGIAWAPAAGGAADECCETRAARPRLLAGVARRAHAEEQERGGCGLCMSSPTCKGLGQIIVIALPPLIGAGAERGWHPDASDTRPVAVGASIPASRVLEIPVPPPKC